MWRLLLELPDQAGLDRCRPHQDVAEGLEVVRLDTLVGGQEDQQRGRQVQECRLVGDEGIEKCQGIEAGQGDLDIYNEDLLAKFLCVSTIFPPAIMTFVMVTFIANTWYMGSTQIVTSLSSLVADLMSPISGQEI